MPAAAGTIDLDQANQRSNKKGSAPHVELNFAMAIGDLPDGLASRFCV
jgi:hypothetical protein